MICPKRHRQHAQRCRISKQQDQSFQNARLTRIVSAYNQVDASQIIKSNLLQLGAELEEASWASGASWWYGFRRVILPLIAPAIAAVGVLAFASAAASTSHVALLATQGNQPLSILQLNLLSHNDFEAASVIGVFILLMTVGVAVTARLLGLRVGLSGTR